MQGCSAIISDLCKHTQKLLEALGKGGGTAQAIGQYLRALLAGEEWGDYTVSGQDALTAEEEQMVVDVLDNSSRMLKHVPRMVRQQLHEMIIHDGPRTGTVAGDFRYAFLVHSCATTIQKVCTNVCQWGVYAHMRSCLCKLEGVVHLQTNMRRRT